MDICSYVHMYPEFILRSLISVQCGYSFLCTWVLGMCFEEYGCPIQRKVRKVDQIQKCKASQPKNQTLLSKFNNSKRDGVNPKNVLMYLESVLWREGVYIRSYVCRWLEFVARNMDTRSNVWYLNQIQKRDAWQQSQLPSPNICCVAELAHGYFVLHAVCPACRAVWCLFFEQFCSRRTVAEQWTAKFYYF